MGFLKKLLVLGVVLVGGLWLYGRSLPREHRVASTITLVASPDSVYRTIRDIAGASRWWGDAISVRRLSRSRESYVQDMGAAGSVSIEVIAEDPPNRFVTRILNDDQQDFGGTWAYTVRRSESGTEVRITEDGWVATPFFRVIAKLRGQRRTMNSYLASLGAHFGETVTPRDGK